MYTETVSDSPSILPWRVMQSDSTIGAFESVIDAAGYVDKMLPTNAGVSIVWSLNLI